MKKKSTPDWLWPVQAFSSHTGTCESSSFCCAIESRQRKYCAPLIQTALQDRALDCRVALVKCWGLGPHGAFLMLIMMYGQRHWWQHTLQRQSCATSKNAALDKLSSMGCLSSLLQQGHLHSYIKFIWPSFAIYVQDISQFKQCPTVLGGEQSILISLDLTPEIKG